MKNARIKVSGVSPISSSSSPASWPRRISKRSSTSVRSIPSSAISPGGPLEVDFIGRFEKIDEDFDHIAGRLGLDVSLPRRNAGTSRPRDYRQLYTDRTAEIVAKAYARDIALFGYDFENGTVAGTS